MEHDTEYLDEKWRWAPKGMTAQQRFHCIVFKYVLCLLPQCNWRWVVPLPGSTWPSERRRGCGVPAPDTEGSETHAPEEHCSPGPQGRTRSFKIIPLEKLNLTQRVEHVQCDILGVKCGIPSQIYQKLDPWFQYLWMFQPPSEISRLQSAPDISHWIVLFS